MTIASALDQLNDKLAGSDQQASQTIEGMILKIIDNIDNGGSGGGEGGGGLVVHVDENGVLDKTYAEIVAAAQVGYVGLVIQVGPIVDVYTLQIYGEDDGYMVGFTSHGISAYFVAETEDGYPVVDKS